MALQKVKSHPGMRISRSTGKLVRVDPRKSMAAKKAAARRKGRKLSASARAKLSKSMKLMWQSGRTKLGRAAKIRRVR